MSELPAKPPHSLDAAMEMMCATQAAQHQLSQMADQKASILVGTTFVIFAIAMGGGGDKSVAGALPVLVLGAFSFVAAIFATAAILPSTKWKKGGAINILFFGSFSQFPQHEYVEKIMDVLQDEEEMCRTIARDIYQNGCVLAFKKYRLLAHAYQVFLAGLAASLLSFVGELIYHAHLV